MAKLSLITMTQDILSDMNSDEVNSIVDTLESMQVAKIIESTYFEMIANKNWPHLKQLLNLDSSADPTKPTHLKLPVGVKELHEMNYDGIKLGETRARIEPIKYLAPDQFLIHTNNSNSDNDIVEEIIDFSGVKILVKNNSAPEYYTSFDDEWIVCDSYDNEVDTTLVGSKTQCYATVSPLWETTDSFVPDLPEEAFPALLAEAKSVCFARIKQAPDAKSEQQSTRQRAWLSRKAWRVGKGTRFPDYGRRSRKNTRWENEGNERGENI